MRVVQAQGGERLYPNKEQLEFLQNLTIMSLLLGMLA